LESTVFNSLGMLSGKSCRRTVLLLK